MTELWKIEFSKSISASQGSSENWSSLSLINALVTGEPVAAQAIIERVLEAPHPENMR